MRMGNCMTHGCRVIGLIGAVLMASQAAAQENSSRWYGSIVGIRDMPDASSASTPTGNFGTLAGDIVLSDEAGFGIAVGRTVAWDLQVEVEATWRDFDITALRGVRVNGQSVPPGFSGTGNWDTETLMVNLRKPFSSGPVRPFIGGGVGLVRHEGTLIHRFAPLGIEGDDTGDDSVLAYQFLVGAQIRAGRNMQAFVGYRYLRSDDIEIKNLTGGFQTHGIEAGVRFLFN
ncbi:MAG: porin family protein [Gammaproteobacteria bacterium]|nr:porin family protein [Gammaproteobacteria bacterium]MYF58949.1 porin family protein [Gammaproteobacteria bacterium]